MISFEEACKEINNVIPIKCWNNFNSGRTFYIELVKPIVYHKTENIKMFFILINKYNFSPVESIPSGCTAYRQFKYRRN